MVTEIDRPRAGYFKESGSTVAFPRSQLQWYFLAQDGTPLRIRDADLADWLTFVLPLAFDFLRFGKGTAHEKDEVSSELLNILIDGTWHPIDRWALLNLLAEHEVKFSVYATPTEARTASLHTTKIVAQDTQEGNT